MKAETKLTREQVLFISFMGVIGNIVYLHTWIDDATDRSAWLASMVGIIIIIPFAVWILYLGKFLENGTILNIIEAGIGKLAASIFYISYFLINIMIGSTHLCMFTSMISSFFLPATPPVIIMAFLVLIGFLLSSGKLQNLARFVEILAVAGLINYFLTFILSFPKDFNIEYVYPIFDTTFWGFIKGSFFIAGTAAETLMILIIFVRHIPTPEKHLRWVIKGIVVASIIFPLAIMIIIAMMSPELAKRIAYGGVNAARLINLGKFLRGLEVFILIAYQVMAIGKVTISLYCAWTAIKDFLNNKIQKILLYITSIIILAVSVQIGSYSKAYSIGVFAASYIILPFSLLTIVAASLCVKYRKNKLVRFLK